MAAGAPGPGAAAATTSSTRSAPAAGVASGGRARARRADPVQEFFSIGEVCALTDLKPHVLRYWETQFRGLSPAKNRAGNRVYARREVELVLFVKHLLYTEKYTLEGARQQLDAHRRAGDLRAAARAALARETAASLEAELRDVLDMLEGRRAPRVARAPTAGDGAERAAGPDDAPPAGAAAG